MGPAFSNFYMLNLESRVFNSINKPNIYFRYVDDILLLLYSHINHVIHIQIQRQKQIGQKQVDSFASGTNVLLTSDLFVEMRRETQFLKVFHVILC